MARWMKVLACVLVVAALVPTASAQEIGGVVVRVDEPARVIVLEDGKMFRVTGDNVVLVDNRPVTLGTLEPGTRVVIRSAEPVMLQNGTYVVMSQPATVVSDPAALPRATVTTTPPVISESQVSGTVARVDATQGIVVFEDGRVVRTGPRTVALVDGRPLQLVEIVPGTTVVLTAVNPVVYRNGRYTLLNQGFRDDSGSTLAPDADFEGFEADVDDAGMQVQAT